nr:MAG TPA: ParB protein [Caudoviricetes sp.]
MSKIVETTIDKLHPDDKNFNKHTEYGMHILEESIRKFGLGRSILIDKNNRIIAGNGVVETASQIDLDKVLVVETMGNTLVAVKRNDIDLDSAEGRELALADNATSEANLEFDKSLIAEVAQDFGFIPEEWGVSVEELAEQEEQEESKKDINTRLIVECCDVSVLSQLFSELQDRGFKCELKE